MRFPDRTRGEDCNIEHWEYIPKLKNIDEINGARSWTLLPKMRIPLNTCLASFEKPGSLLDCANACVGARLKICATFAPKIMPNFCTNPLFYRRQMEEQNKAIVTPEMRCVTINGTFFEAPQKLVVTNIKPGDYVYITGHPDYSTRHPSGVARGENLYFVGYAADGLKRYIGFGNLFQSGPRTAQEIQKDLALQYVGDISIPPEELDAAFKTIRALTPYHSSFLVDLVKSIRLADEASPN